MIQILMRKFTIHISTLMQLLSSFVTFDIKRTEINNIDHSATLILQMVLKLAREIFIHQLPIRVPKL
jgi:hypothetical protein